MKGAEDFSTASCKTLFAQPRFVALCAAALIAAWGGWKLFWFLTDDAFIAFRYVSNSMLGYGLVWNPPPFRPVEGYTCLLWVLLLEGVWRLTGWTPPEVANHILLLFGYGSLALCALFVGRMHLPSALVRHRLALLAWVFVGVLSNRTFMTWLSSGLETALFNFLLTWWIYSGLTARSQRGPHWVASICSSVVLTTLTRPDGLLFLLATLVMLVLHAVEWENRLHIHWHRLRLAFPLLVLPLHLLWRRSYYGEWLPNTYYAKYVEPWPESGVRYLASFVVEYALWFWVIIALWWLARSARTWAGDWPARVYEHHASLLVIGAVGAHVGYYTLKIGGDHFEYRVFSYLIPLAHLSAIWLLARTVHSMRAVHVGMALLWLLSLPIPWLHWQETRHLTTRGETFMMTRPIAHRFPIPLQPIVARWDEWQRWLISHSVCMRHQEHKVFWLEGVNAWPPREVGSRFRWEPERLVTAMYSVGVASWILPQVAIIDKHGLNDWVIARNPIIRKERHMAHSRVPIIEYITCFQPNFFINNMGKATIERRPLPDEVIRGCETHDWLALATAEAERMRLEEENDQ